MGMLVTVNLAHTSGLPEDTVSNTFAIAEEQGSGQRGGGALGLLADKFSRFYSLALAELPQEHLGKYLSPVISRGISAHQIRIYDLDGHLDGSPHGSPIYSVSMSIGATASFGLPSEVAIACTTEAGGRGNQPVERADGADEGTEVDRPMQRHTGRIYFGPLSGDALSGDNPQRPSGGCRQTLVSAMARLQTDIRAIPNTDWAWGVWSRKDLAIRGIAKVWVDDAFDVQRRRGEKPTARTMANTV